MRSELVNMLTVAICVLTALSETVLGIASSTRLSASDAIVILFIVGPYLLLASLAWCHRGLQEGAWTSLVIAIGISAWGLYIFVDHCYRLYTDPQFRKVQSMAIFFVPLAQWAIVLLLGCLSVVRTQKSRHQQVGTGV